MIVAMALLRLCNSCILTSLFLWMSQVNAIVLDHQTKMVNLASTAQVLKDDQGTLEIDYILSHSKDFVPGKPSGEDLNFGFTPSTYWIKLSLSRAQDADSTWILSIPYQTLDHLTLYAPGKDPVITGNLMPFSSRPIKGRFFAFPLTLETEPQNFYLQVQSQYALTIPMEIWSTQAYFESNQDTWGLQALYFGELLALVIYNFLLYLYLRDKSFLLYTFFGISMGLAMFAGNGYGRIYMWQNFPHWDAVSQCVFLSLASIFGIFFSINFLNSKKNTSRLYKILICMSVCYAVIAVMLPLAHSLRIQTSYFFFSFAVLAPITTLLLVANGVLALRSGQREARFFLLAWGILWVGGFIAAMRAFGFIPSTLTTNYAVQISSALEMLLLSFALADRIRIERQSRERAQIDKIKAESKLVEALKNSELMLEKTVAQRTNELEISLKKEKNLRDIFARFGAFISHEFRNPLNLIESQVALFRRERKHNIDNAEERLNNISYAAHHLADLFNRWLQSDRLNHEIISAAPERIELEKWLPEFINSIHTLYKNHHIYCVNISTTVLFADVGLLKTALINLIDNATKYSKPGSPIILSTIDTPQMIGIEVKDQGVGVPPEYSEKIFKEYFRTADVGQIPGIGLGLAFVQQILDLHKGKIELVSKPGLGSAFRLWFPKSKGDLGVH